jgi:hypothetical protein
MMRIWHRLFAARPMAEPTHGFYTVPGIPPPEPCSPGPPTDFDDMPTGSGWIGPSPNSCHHPFSCASRAEYTELLTMYALARRKVLSQAEEIERLKAER